MDALGLVMATAVSSGMTISVFSGAISGTSSLSFGNAKFIALGIAGMTMGGGTAGSYYFYKPNCGRIFIAMPYTASSMYTTSLTINVNTVTYNDGPYITISIITFN